MTFIAHKIQTSGTASMVHQVQRVETANGRALAYVNSFASEQAFNMEQPMLNWQEAYEIPVSALNDAQAWLISTDGPFAGGTVIDGATPLEVAKAAQWALVKQERDMREADTFPYLERLFDSDQRSVSRITVAVQAAQAALSMGAPYEVEWTLADNSSLLLSAEQMCGVPLAMALHGNTLHQTARALRTQIEAAETVEEVRAVVWENSILPQYGAMQAAAPPPVPQLPPMPPPPAPPGE